MAQILHISDLHLIATGSVGDWVSWLFKSLPKLSEAWSVADPIIQNQLPADLNKIAASEPSVLALTGDIITFPWESENSIHADHYKYIQSLIDAMPDSELFPILGNHDWKLIQTNFRNTAFDKAYEILQPRVDLYELDGIKVLLFRIDTSNAFFPATGEVWKSHLLFLEETFNEGKNGQLQQIPNKQDYFEALKVLLLHHSPLEHSSYPSMLGNRAYGSLELVNRPELLQKCREDIDIFLFGHTHHPVADAINGFVFVDAGSTLSSVPTGASPNQHLALIRIPNRNVIEVETYSWNQVEFARDSPQPRIFKRNSAQGVLGKGGWA